MHFQDGGSLTEKGALRTSGGNWFRQPSIRSLRCQVYSVEGADNVIQSRGLRTLRVRPLHEGVALSRDTSAVRVAGLNGGRKRD